MLWAFLVTLESPFATFSARRHVWLAALSRSFRLFCLAALPAARRSGMADPPAHGQKRGRPSALAKAAAGCADIRACLRAGAQSRPGRELTPEQETALLVWSEDAANAPALAWRSFHMGAGLLLYEANVNLLPAAFVTAFDLGDATAANFQAAALEALQVTVNWYAAQQAELASLQAANGH